MTNQPKHFYEFGPFRLDPARPRLWRDGQTVALTPKALELLLTLIRHGGQVIEKDELMQQVWPDTFVEEGNLSVHISALRKALGEPDGGQSYIETVPRQGYRFVANVQEIRDEPEALIVERHTRARVVIEEVETESQGEAGERFAESQPRSLPTVPTSARRSYLATFAALTLLTVLAGALAYAWISDRTKQRATSTALKSIAVLPLKSLNPREQEENHLGLGIADALITRLGGLKGVRVRPTNSILKYADPQTDPLAAGRALGVDAVLNGYIQRDGERLRVTAQLVSVGDETQLWAGKFDDDLTRIFNVQDSMSEQIAGALALKLSGEEKERLVKRHTANAQAYQLYLKGNYEAHKGTPDGWRKSIEYFQQAITEDPRYALAHAGLSVSYNLLGGFGAMRPEEAMSKAREAALKAQSLDDSLAEAHLALGFVRWGFDWNWAEAEREFKRAIELGPTTPSAHNTYAHYLISMGRTEEAIAESKLALELNPTDPYMHEDLGWVYFNARRYEQALEECLRTLEMDPNAYGAYLIIGWIKEQKGLRAEAIAALEKARDLSPDNKFVEVELAYEYALAGRKEEAQKTLNELKNSTQPGYTSPYHLVIIYAGLGEKEKAIEHLQRAYEQRMSEMVFLKMETKFNGLRPDPRFQELLRRVGLAD